MVVFFYLRGVVRFIRVVGDGRLGRRRRGFRVEVLVLYFFDGRKAGRDKRREEGREESRREGAGVYGFFGNLLEMFRELELGSIRVRVVVFEIRFVFSAIVCLVDVIFYR